MRGRARRAWPARHERSQAMAMVGEPWDAVAASGREEDDRGLLTHVEGKARCRGNRRRGEVAATANGVGVGASLGRRMGTVAFRR